MKKNFDLKKIKWPFNLDSKEVSMISCVKIQGGVVGWSFFANFTDRCEIHVNSYGCCSIVYRLSGTHPFAGDDDEEIYNNVCFVRYRSAELYRGLSVEATRLIMETLKVLPE